MVTKGLLNRYIGYLNSGCNLSSKLRLAIILAFTNHIVLDKVSRSIRKIIIKLANWLSQGITTNIYGLKFRMVDYESCYVCTPLFEDWSWDYLQIKEADVFVDIGAHIGRYTLPVAKAVGERGLVIAVEANVENYNCLRDNIKLNNLHNIITVNAAAWSDNKKLKFYLGESSGQGSTKRNMGDKGDTYIEVNGRSVDSLLEEIKPGIRVDWIKIDVEGAELEVLKGLNNTLLQNSPQLLVEVSEENRNDFEHSMYMLNYRYCTIPDSKCGELGNTIYYYCWRNENLYEVNEK